METGRTQCANIFEWIVEEPGVLQDDLDDPYVAMTLYRWLTQEAQAVVVYMMALPYDEPLTVIARRVFDYNTEAMDSAKRIGIFKQKTPGVWALHSGFQRGMHDAAACGGKYRLREKVQKQLDLTQAITLGTEDGVSQWESVLRLLLNPEAIPADQQRSAAKHQRLLRNGGFCDASGVKTSAGYQLLIQPLHEQVWRIVQVHIEESLALYPNDAQRLEYKKRVLMLLLALPFHDLDVWVALPKEELALFAFYGIITVQKVGSSGLYKATPVGRMLAMPPGSHGGADVVEGQDGALIVETNNRVYAYTTDAFKVGMLQLFAEVELQTVGMTVARLTRETLSEAFRNNMTSEQILTYLQNNAHPQMSGLPGTVVDMVKSWESEMRRASFVPGVVLSGPATHIQQLHRVAVQLHPSEVLHYSTGVLVVTPRLEKQLAAT
eukprot:TRINITY_DN28456_c0_g1_i1.p1 TRINITY_DN28456_c0_g1~~TRINITY_DN28456_c0_g1_i1.p1  ORF type:complete len:436 (+),score=135.79 TRINITY_DN28456_c0_g1_i1:99-1406(+)